MPAPRSFEQYIGIPFKDDGLDFDGCHCWGLHRLILEMEAGIEVPSYDHLESSQLAGHARAFLRGQKDAELGTGDYRPVSAPQALDLVIMRGRPIAVDGRHERLPIHCGTMADFHNVIHIERGINSVCVPLRHVSIKRRIIGLYRHREL